MEASAATKSVMPTVEWLRERYMLCEKTGVLCHKRDTRDFKAGTPVNLFRHEDGPHMWLSQAWEGSRYRHTKRGIAIRAARVVFALVHGWHPRQVRRIDRKKGDEIENLRGLK